MALFFSTTPNPSSQEEGTTGSDFSSIILILTHPRTACECPSSDFCLRTPVLFCPDCQRMPRFVFRADTGVCPYSWMKNAVLCSPKLHFRCISNTLQSYEKILKLTNCKHKIFKKFFVGAAILLCIKQLQKFKSKILITNDLRHFHRPYLPHLFLPVCVTRYRLQFFYGPIIRREA